MGQSKHRITGMGAVSAAGWGLDATADRLFAGKGTDASCAAETRFLKMADAPEASAETKFLPNALALTAIDEAIQGAGLTRADLGRLRVGVCVGSTVGPTNYDEEFCREFFSGKFPGAGFLRDFFHTNTAQFLARHLNLTGPAQMLSNACTSGADAIGVGANWLDADLCDIVICGGTETILERVYLGFRSLMLASPVRCKPFDRKRQGLTLGEGAGIVVLEKNSSPRKALAEFLGYGSASDAFHPTSPDPDARGLDLAVHHALRRTGLKLETVDFVNAHATGTPHNDLAEGRWLKKHAPGAHIVATKGYTGHTLGAAGALEAVLTVMSLQRGLLPVSTGFEEGDPEIGVTPTTQLTSGDFKTALSFSLGFGGLNAALAPREGSMIPVVISGIGHCGSLGLGTAALKSAWLDGARPEPTIEMVKTDHGEVPVPVLRTPAFNLPKLVPEAVERRMARFAKLTMMAASEAMADADIMQPEDPRRTAMVVGTAFGSLDLSNVYHRRIIRDGPGGASPSLFAASIFNALAAHLTLTFGIRGPNSTVATMEQTAIASLRLAYDWIQTGVADRVAVVLGDEISEYHLYYFAHNGGAFPAGEGMVTLILEREDQAKKKYARLGAPSLTSAATEGTVYRAGEGHDTHAAMYGGTVMGMAFELAFAALTVERSGETVTCVQTCRKLPPQSVIMSGI